MSDTQQRIVNYPRGSGRTLQLAGAKPSVSVDEYTGPDLTLTAPPDPQVVRRNKRLEFAEQCAYFDQVNAAKALHKNGQAERDGADMIFAIPNANVAGVKVGAALVKQGLRAGVPDIFVAVARWRWGGALENEMEYHGLFIEMKKASGVPSDVEPHQRDWHERLRDRRYKVCVCFGWREAWAVTCDYLGWRD